MEEHTVSAGVRIQNLVNHCFANHLLLQQIIKNLEKNDLLRLGCVNKLWCLTSRSTLKRYHKCEIMLACDSPCKALQRLNSDLHTYSDIFYNGLNHDFRPQKLLGRPLSSFGFFERQSGCLDCPDDKRVKPTMEKVREMYSNILDNIRFETITAREIFLECPFYQFLRILLTEKSNVIKELHIIGNDVSDYFLENISFSNLKILTLPTLYLDEAVRLITTETPKLQKVANGEISVWWNYNTEIMEQKLYCKSHLLTTRVITNSIYPFLSQNLQPKWEKLIIRTLCNPGNEHSFSHYVPGFLSNLANASATLCTTLRQLECGMNLLLDITGIPNIQPLQALEEIRTGLEKNFEDEVPPKQLTLEKVSRLRMMNFREFAPRLNKISLLKRWDGKVVYNRPIADMNSNCTKYFIDYSVQEIFLTDPQTISNLLLTTKFPNISIVSISRDENDPCLNSWMRAIFDYPQIFPQLKELEFTRRFPWLSENNALDVLLNVHAEELEDISNMSFEDCQNLYLVPSRGSLLNRKGLKRLVFTIGYYKKIGTFDYKIMSVGAAALLSAKMPGLCIDLQIICLKSSYEGTATLLDKFTTLKNYASVAKIVMSNQLTGWRIVFDRGQSEKLQRIADNGQNAYRSIILM